MSKLVDQNGMASLALRFTILCASRTSETTGATWDEIEISAPTWIIAGSRMKVDRQHVVPLTDGALAVLDLTTPLRRKNGFVFPSPSVGSLSNMAMASVLRRVKRTDITIRGMRSSFRQWAADHSYSSEVAEKALAHTLKVVERAYQRSDLLDLRAPMMQAWSVYLGESI